MSSGWRFIVYGIAFVLFVLALGVDLRKPKWKRLTILGLIAAGLACMALVPLVDAYIAT